MSLKSLIQVFGLSNILQLFLQNQCQKKDSPQKFFFVKNVFSWKLVLKI